MCGRYATTRSGARLSSVFQARDETGAGPQRADAAADDADAVEGDAATDGDTAERDAAGSAEGGFTPRYNVAPTTRAPVVRQREHADGRVVSTGIWGFLPPWAEDLRDGARMINARAETVATARAYASSFRARRALVPVDGWYEWHRRPEGGKQPYFVTPADGSVLALAGLWRRWGPRGLLTFTVVTTSATGPLADIHHRMPLTVAPDQWQAWLDGADLTRAPVPEEFLAGLELRPVGTTVNRVTNEGPELTARVSPRPPADDAPSATLF